ncbi:hypothetical protein A2313_03760 [Candidatus Roizmanbacteria bacterium RIFOXYB2_FULL_41_10]|nr:MAG: hypothetical protein A2313_03760 [Candidatus Roizmanbacteria bacterium RIFOXYB2_FULL_41_10]
MRKLELSDSRPAIIRFITKFWEAIKRLLTIAIIITIVPMYYFGTLWLASNSHYINKLFTVRAMNVTNQTVELEIK